MDQAGNRWRGRILGIGMMGNEVYLVQKVTDNQELHELFNGEWISMFDHRFVEELNSMHEFSINSDEPDQD